VTLVVLCKWLLMYMWMEGLNVVSVAAGRERLVRVRDFNRNPGEQELCEC